MEHFNLLRDAVAPGEIRRMLVLKLHHHGDVLPSSPVFFVLKLSDCQATLGVGTVLAAAHELLVR